MSSNRVAVTRRIAAPASTLFAIVADPAGHVRIDGSGMLVAAPDARPLTTVGETFEMDMDRAPLGDIPGLGKYHVRNTVTQVVPDRLIEWNVAPADRPPVGHVYGWQLEPVDDEHTEVTNYCDWSSLSDEIRSQRDWPVVPASMLEQSIANLERVAVSDRST